MDRTTLTAALKPLERRGLVRIAQDKIDRRSRILILTANGRALLVRAAPIWKQTHAEIEERLSSSKLDDLLRLRKVSVKPGDARYQYRHQNIGSTAVPGAWVARARVLKPPRGSAEPFAPAGAQARDAAARKARGRVADAEISDAERLRVWTAIVQLLYALKNGQVLRVPGLREGSRNRALWLKVDATQLQDSVRK